jgi:catalase
MKTVHIPDVLATGKFSHHVFSKVLVDDDEGTNYSIQYHCDCMETLQDYQENEAPKLQDEHTKRYKDHFVAFRTLLEIV